MRFGKYEIRFIATDIYDRTTVVTKDFFVVDTTAPNIALKGPATIYLEAKKEIYVEQGATVTDNYDTTVQSSLIVTGNVDPTTVGTYIVTYYAKDTSR